VYADWPLEELEDAANDRAAILGGVLTTVVEGAIFKVSIERDDPVATRVSVLSAESADQRLAFIGLLEAYDLSRP